MSSSEDSHYCQLGKSLALFREEEHLTDVTLIAGDKRIPAHRNVLSASSKYFKAMFSRKYKESSCEEVEINCVDGDTLLEIVNFCYSGTMEPSDEDMALRIFEVSDYFGVPNAAAICYEFLKDNMKLPRCIEMFCFAERHNLQSLKDDAFRLIAKNFDEVRNFDSFQTLNAEQMGQILQSDELNVKSEKDVFDALMSWYNFDKESRESDLSPLVSLLNLPPLPPSVTRRLLLKQSIDFGEVMQMIKQFDWETVPLRRGPKTSFSNRLLGVSIKHEINGGRVLQWMRFSKKKDQWVNCGRLAVECPDKEGASIDHRVLIGNSVLYLTDPKGHYFKYDLASNRWEYVNVRRQSAGAACIDDSLYIVGGVRTKLSFADDKGYLGKVDEDGFEKIHRKSPMMFDRKNPGVCVVGKELYAVGGSTDDGDTARVEMYSPSSNDWVVCTPLPVSAENVTLTVYDGEMHAVFFKKDSSRRSQMNKYAYRYIRSSNRWVHFPETPHAVRTPSMCTFNGELIVSGKTPNAGMVVMAYDPSKSYWREIPAPSTEYFQLLTLPQDTNTRNKWLELMLL